MTDVKTTFSDLESAYDYAVGDSRTYVADSKVHFLIDTVSKYIEDNRIAEEATPLSITFGGHTYSEGDKVEFLHDGRWILTVLEREGGATGKTLRATDPWDYGGGYCPRILRAVEYGVVLCGGIDDIRPVQGGGAGLNFPTIDFGDIDPAVIQRVVDAFVHRSGAS